MIEGLLQVISVNTLKRIAVVNECFEIFLFKIGKHEG